MSEETIQLIAAATVAVCQIYIMEPWKFPVFAKLWDIIAIITGQIANMLGHMSMRARENYYTALSEVA